MISFVFCVYMKLKAYLTTNVYEVPYFPAEGYNVKGNINSGWQDSPLGFQGATKAVKGTVGLFTSWIPIVGPIINRLTGYITKPFDRITMSSFPDWKGPQIENETVETTFYLFNDSMESALENFIFVNTILPNTLWYQSNLLQFPPALYDVKISGIGTIYACNISNAVVKGIGVYRKPSMKFLKMLLWYHSNDSFDFKLNDFIESDLVRIPDIYQITLSFKSVLPKNFNTYLFSFANNMFKSYSNKNASLFSDSIINDLTSGFIGAIKKGWTEGYKTEAEEENQQIPPTVEQTQQEQQLDQRAVQYQSVYSDGVKGLD